jgi:hypothetical protein
VALAASFVSTHVYYASLEEGEEAVMEQSTAWMIVTGLSGSWGTCFLAFLKLMSSGYKGTFFSLQTGHMWVKMGFLTGTTDIQKSYIHGYNRKQWASIRDDVKVWTLENWERWEDEKPEFFNDNFRASVEDDMIPAASLRALNIGGSSRRRSSLGDVLGIGGEERRVAPVN